MPKNDHIFTPENTTVTYQHTDPKSETIQELYFCAIPKGFTHEVGKAVVHWYKNMPDTTHLDYIEVYDDFRRRGAGKLILQGLVSHFKTAGHPMLLSDELSVDGLHLHKAVFGENLHFYDPSVSDTAELPVSFEQALKTAEAVAAQPAHIPLYETRHTGFGVRTELHTVTTDTWPLPVAYEDYRDGLDLPPHTQRLPYL